MGKKKPFIDKKKASSYTLLHRSQRDVADDLIDGDTRAQGMVLWPQPRPDASNNGTNTTNLPSTNRAVTHSLTAWRAQLEAAGLLDVQDHERYLKPMTGQGTFVDARTGQTTRLDTHQQPQQQPSVRMESSSAQDDDDDDALLEVTRQYDSIPLTAECMDDDIAQVLFGDFEEGDFEELNDDFILQAAAEPSPQDPPEGDAAADDIFDFDEHIQRLLAKAAAERRDREPSPNTNTNRWRQQDQAFFAHCKPLHEQQHDDDEDDDDDFSGDPSFLRYGAGTVTTEPGVAAKLGAEEERALCEKFEATLAEYDDNDSDGGALADIPEESIPRHTRPLEGDAFLEAALDDFLQEKQDDIFIQGTRHYLDEQKRTGGSGFAVLVGTRMVPAKELDAGDDHPEQEPAQPVQELLAHAQERLALPKEKPPAEEIFIDGKSYFSERERNPFDCESILSTYSNLDNNPTTIGTSSRRRQRKSKLASLPNKSDQEPVQHIQLSAKTGLPVGVLDKKLLMAGCQQDDHDEDLDDTFVSINRGEARNRNETPEEKKARKLLVKRERELARMQKKITKQVYAEEFQKRSVETDDAVAGKTVFRF